MSAPAFVVTLCAMAGSDGIRELRGLLKCALRTYGLRTIEVQEHPAVVRRRRSDATQARRGDTPMDMSKYAGSAFLSLDDVQDGPIRGEIAAVEIGNYEKPVVTFTNGLKFSLNATNTAALIKAFGKERATIGSASGSSFTPARRNTRHNDAFGPGACAHARGRRREEEAEADCRRVSENAAAARPIDDGRRNSVLTREQLAAVTCGRHGGLFLWG